MNDKPTQPAEQVLQTLDKAMELIPLCECARFANWDKWLELSKGISVDMRQARSAVAEIIRRNGELETALKRIRNMAGSSGALDLSIALPVRHIAEEALTGSDGRQQISSLRTDAERYRYLRSCNLASAKSLTLGDLFQGDEALDSAIDKAIAATPSPQREAMAGARTACHAEEPGLLTAVDKPAIGWVHDVEEKVTTIGRAGKYYVFPPSAQPATQREEDHS